MNEENFLKKLVAHMNERYGQILGKLEEYGIICFPYKSERYVKGKSEVCIDGKERKIK